MLALERAGGFGETGAGVQLRPTATRVPHRLELGAALRGIGVTPGGFGFRRWADDTTQRPSGDAPRGSGSAAPTARSIGPDLIDLIRFDARVTEVTEVTEVAEVTVGGDGEPAGVAVTATTPTGEIRRRRVGFRRWIVGCGRRSRC